MFIFDLFNLKSHCTHDFVSIESDGGYCPTCKKRIPIDEMRRIEKEQKNLRRDRGCMYDYISSNLN